MKAKHTGGSMPRKIGLLLSALALGCGGTASRTTDAMTGGANGAGESGITEGGAAAVNSGGASGNAGAISDSGATNSAGAVAGTDAVGGAGNGGTAGMGAMAGVGGWYKQGHYVTPSANGTACAASGALERFDANFQVCLGGCAPGCQTWTCICRDGAWLCSEPEFICDTDPAGSTSCSTKAELRYDCHCSSDALRCEQDSSSGGAGGSGGAQ